MDSINHHEGSRILNPGMNSTAIARRIQNGRAIIQTRELRSVLFILATVGLLVVPSIRTFAAIETPTNFRADPADVSDIDGTPGHILAQFRWTDNATNETAYQGWISTNGVDFFLAATLAAGAQGWDTALVPWTSNRTFKVRAINATEQSAFTSAITLTGIMPPYGLTGTTAATNAITISWQAAGPSTSPWIITGYIVQADTNTTFASPGLVEWSVPGQATTSTNITYAFELNVIYYFRVLSTCAQGNSEAMNKPRSYLAVAPNGPPTAPTFISEHMDANAGEALALLDDTALNRTGWLFQSSTNGGSTYQNLNAEESGGTRQVWTHASLVGGTNYIYRAAATNSIGNSAYTTWTFIPPKTPVGTWTTYYVSTNGSGNGNFTGTNWANAWAGLGAINWPILNPGDVVYVDGGASGITYTNYIVTFTSGSYGNPILIKTATNAPNNGFITVYGQITYKSDYVTVDGSKDANFNLVLVKQITNNINLKVTGRSDAQPGVYLYHAVGNAIKWCEVTDIGNPGVSEGEAAGIQYGDFGGSTNAEVAYCYVHDVFGNGLLGSVALTNIGLGNIRIHHNWFERWHNNMMGGLGSSDVYNNWSDEGWKGPGVAHPDGPEGSPTYTRLWNNHFFNISPVSGNALNIGLSEDNTVYHDFACVNNVFAQDSGAIACLLGHQGTPDGVTISNAIIAGNVFYSGDDATTFSIVTGTVDNWTAKKILFANNILKSGANAGGAGLFSSGRLRFADSSDFVFDFNMAGGTSKIISYRTNNVNTLDVFDFPTAEAFNAWSSLYKSNSSTSACVRSPAYHDLGVYGLDTNAIDRGTNLTSWTWLIPAITNDINGSPRGQGSGWDIGAYEHDPSLVLYYDFENYTNAAGSVVQDMSGRNNHGLTVTNRTITNVGNTNYAPGTVAGYVGSNAVNFINLGVEEQTNRYGVANPTYTICNWIGITNWNGIDVLSNGTWASWVNWTNTLADSTLFDSGADLADDNGWIVSSYNLENLALQLNTNSTRVPLSYLPNTLGSNVWIHVAYTWNSTNHSIICYTNGVQSSSNAFYAPYLRLVSSSHNAMIGGMSFGLDYLMNNGHPNNGWFNGYMDEFRINNRDMSASEIYALALGGTAPAISGGSPEPPPSSPTNITVRLTGQFQIQGQFEIR